MTTDYRLIGDWCVIGEEGRYVADFYMRGAEYKDLELKDLELFARDAKKTCRVLNAYDAVVLALRIAKCEIENGGTVDRELVLKKINEALALTETPSLYGEG